MKRNLNVFCVLAEMAPVEADQSKPVGIIYPPPEVRNIVDKTASFVARNGPEFEQRIKQKEFNNPRFNFLNGGDPYNAYYQHRVNELRDGPSEPAVAAAAAQSAQSETVKQRQSDILKSVVKEQEPPPPKDPPPEFEFIADPPSISAFDLDVVKLTAQFVARNGRQFLTNLMHREQKNYQFDFLRPQHSLFQYFTKLLEQYTKVLIPPKDLTKKLSEEANQEKKVLEQVKYRVAWIKHQEAKKRREEEQAERERVSYAQIDWHSFVVVETVDYQPWEVGNFPPPTNPTEVGARVIMQRRVESNPAKKPPKNDAEEEEGGSNLNVEDMDEESSDEETDVVGMAPPTALGKPQVNAAPAVNQPAPALPTPGNVEVRKYDPKQAKAQKKKDEGEEFLVSPITGERVPASKVQEHMRIGLLDPRWVEERDKQITKQAVEEQVYAPGTSIESSLRNLAERRTDIFGVGDEAAHETAIGKKMGEEEKREEKVTWDGHSSSAEAAARAARANITLDEQIEQIHRNKGLIAQKEAIGPSKTQASQPPPAAPPPQQPPQPPIPLAVAVAPAPVAMMPVRPMVQPFFMPPAGVPFGAVGGMEMPPMQLEQEDEPPNKRARGEDNLMGEAEFMSRNPSQVTFKVLAPNMADKPEWKLNGQLINVTLQLRDTVSAIKAKIHEETGMPPGKQKLQMDNIFFKDSNSLAYYNISPRTLVNLQVKERGGRKK